MGSRYVIAGGPRTGKSTLAYRMSTALGLDPLAIQHTDDLVGVLQWSEASSEVATWFDQAGPSIIEGVATPRALRKWLEAHPDGRPCDVLVFLTEPKRATTRGQDIMAKGLRTVLDGILDELRARGVDVVFAADVRAALAPRVNPIAATGG